MNELFEEFQEFRKILCVCPCGGLHRVSDLRLNAKGAAVRTWLDEYQKKEQALLKKEDKFGEEEAKLREKAKEKGRKEAKKVFNNTISPSFKSLKLDPYDLKPILNPVDFVVFNGMNEKDEISDILLLSKKCQFPSICSARKQIESVVSNGSYGWQVARINENGNILFE